MCVHEKGHDDDPKSNKVKLLWICDIPLNKNEAIYVINELIIQDIPLVVILLSIWILKTGLRFTKIPFLVNGTEKNKIEKSNSQTTFPCGNDFLTRTKITMLSPLKQLPRGQLFIFFFENVLFFGVCGQRSLNKIWNSSAEPRQCIFENKIIKNRWLKLKNIE